MSTPVIYLYTEEANTEVIVCPDFMEVIHKDKDAFVENDEPDQEPLDEASVAALRERNAAFSSRLGRLLMACRRLKFAKRTRWEGEIKEINTIMEEFGGF